MEFIKSLSTLTRLLYSHYNKLVILLIDEYDVPLAKATNNDYYNEMLSVMRGFMQVLENSNHLNIAVLTGYLRISKESIFTGTNNFMSVLLLLRNTVNTSVLHIMKYNKCWKMPEL